MAVGLNVKGFHMIEDGPPALSIQDVMLRMFTFGHFPPIRRFDAPCRRRICRKLRTCQRNRKKTSKSPHPATYCASFCG